MATKSQLVIRSGPNPGKIFEFDKPELYIGRDISNDIVINDAEVSRKHARFVVQGEDYIVEDLGSTNGTIINGQRITGPHVLSSGESIQMGENVVLVYEVTTYDPDSTAVMTPRETDEFDTSAEEQPPLPELEPEFEARPSETMAEPSEADETPPPEPVFEPEPEPEPMPEPMEMPASQEPSDTYTGEPAQEMPSSQVPEEAQPEEKKSSRTALYAGCGCLLVLLCIGAAAGLYYVDLNNLWCTIPFFPGC